MLPPLASPAPLQLVNQPNSQGATPLMLACKAGSVECIQLLLAAGADPYAVDRESRCTCLHYAARYGWAHVIEALLGDGNWVAAPAGGSSRKILLRKAMLFNEAGLFKVGSRLPASASGSLVLGQIQGAHPDVWGRECARGGALLHHAATPQSNPAGQIHLPRDPPCWLAGSVRSTLMGLPTWASRHCTWLSPTVTGRQRRPSSSGGLPSPPGATCSCKRMAR